MCSGLFIFLKIITVITVLIFFGSDHVSSYDVRQHKNWHLVDFGEICGNNKPRKTPNALASRILGGINAKPFEFPWLVQPVMEVTFEEGKAEVLCGGSIINKRYILTAAHCCHNRFPDAKSFSFSVRFGDRAGRAGNTKGAVVESVVYHEHYDTTLLTNDVCLMRLKTPLRFTATLLPICLPDGELQRTDLVGGTPLTIAGWGLVLQGPDGDVETEVLQKADIEVLDPAVCIKKWEEADFPIEVFPDLQFCGGNDKVDACMGDSGGPVMYKKKQGEIEKHFVMGVVSWGQTCERNKTDEPSIFVKISHFMPWILDHIKE